MTSASVAPIDQLIILYGEDMIKALLAKKAYIRLRETHAGNSDWKALLTDMKIGDRYHVEDGKMANRGAIYTAASVMGMKASLSSASKEVRTARGIIVERVS